MNDFHTLAAQVIPVLLLAAAFESRCLQRKPQRYGGLERENDPVVKSTRVHIDTNPFQPVGMVLLISFIGLGELFALYAVYAGESVPWQNAWVLISAALALITVIVPLVTLHARDLWHALPAARGARFSWVATMIFFLGMTLYTMWMILAIVATAPANTK